MAKAKAGAIGSSGGTGKMSKGKDPKKTDKGKKPAIPVKLEKAGSKPQRQGGDPTISKKILKIMKPEDG